MSGFGCGFVRSSGLHIMKILSILNLCIFEYSRLFFRNLKSVHYSFYVSVSFLCASVLITAGKRETVDGECTAS